MARNGPTRPGNELRGQYGSTHVHHSPWGPIYKKSPSHMSPKSWPLFRPNPAKSGQLAGRRSRHIGQFRPNPFPDCCRSPRVSANAANPSPYIAGRSLRPWSTLEKGPKNVRTPRAQGPPVCPVLDSALAGPPALLIGPERHQPKQTGPIGPERVGPNKMGRAGPGPGQVQVRSSPLLRYPIGRAIPQNNWPVSEPQNLPSE